MHHAPSGARTLDRRHIRPVRYQLRQWSWLRFVHDVGIEPTTLGLWDLRAANCANRASCHGLTQQKKCGLFWRYRVSIPVPRACEARTLPIELYPLPQLSVFQLRSQSRERVVQKTDKKNALTGNRTRATPLATAYSNHWTISAY